MFPHPDPLCVSLASSDQLSPSARRRPQRPHVPPRLGEVILTFCSFVSNTPNGTTPCSPPGVLFPFLFRLKSPAHLKVFYRFPLLQDEEGGRVRARRRRVPPFQNSHRSRRRRSFSGGWGGEAGGRPADGWGGKWGEEEEFWGAVCRSCFGAPGFGRRDGTAHSCFRWSLISSSSVYSDGSSPGFSNLPT